MKKIIIVGGGVAGLSAAYHLKKYHLDYSVTILEKDSECGKRIKVSGNGRCNFSNANPNPSFYKHGDLVSNILSEYQEYEKEFLNDINLHYYHDEEGRYYPITNSSKTVHFLLLTAIKKLGVEIIQDTFVNGINKKGDIYYVLTNKGDYPCDKVVLTSGGISYLYSETNQDYLKSLNIKVTKLTPSLCPILTKEKIDKQIVGKRAKAKVHLYLNNQEVYSESGELIFKKDGLSGIVIFNISSIIAQSEINPNLYSVRVDFCEDFTLDEINTQIHRFGKEIALKSLLVDEIADFFIKQKSIDQLKGIIYHIEGLYPFKESQVTSGGISLKQVDLNNLSLINDSNIYVGGELLDVDGRCGGFNIFFALASGYFIAKHFE